MEELHNDIMRGIGRLEGKMESVCDRLDRQNGTLEKHEKMINENTNWRNNMVGRISIIVTIIGAVVALAVSWFSKKL